jgi:Ca2+:H+ antiporter
MGMRPYHFLYVALGAAPAAIVLRWLDAGPVSVFVAAAVGIVPLAALLGRATDAVASRMGPQVGGLLNATFGNAAELILGLVALRRGMFSVVKASLTGSILGNALLVLGLSLLVGGLRHRRQTFDRVTVGLQSTLLVLAAIGLTIPSVLFPALGPEVEVRLSQQVAAVLLLTYLVSVVFALATDRQTQECVGVPPEKAEPPAWRTGTALVALGSATALIAVLSELLVGAIETAQEHGYLATLGMSEVFVGVVVLAVLGNAAENSTAILMAYRNKVDLSLHIAIGSSLQIALVVTPVLVFASLYLAPEPLDLHFTLAEVLAVGASVIVVALVAADGQSHWMEGVLLLAVYLILALTFYHVPANAP